MASGTFLKCDLRLEHKGQTHFFFERLASRFGVTGLPWDKIPASDYGVKLPGALITSRGELEVETSVIREVSSDGDTMALRFGWNDSALRTFDGLLAEQGLQVKVPKRSLPRIPAERRLGVFPLNAILEVADPLTGKIHLLICNVDNLSPTGILLSSENPSLMQFGLLTPVTVTLEPRGGFGVVIRGFGTVRRFMDEVDPVSKNPLRHMGIEWSRMDQGTSASYKRLIREIVTILQNS